MSSCSSEYRRRLLHYNSLATVQEQTAARFFYLECRRFVGWLAGISNLTIHQVAAIIAALSPRMVWRQNQIEAIAICIGHSEDTSRKHGYQALPRDLRKARTIADSTDPETTIRTTLLGPKVNAFYRNMLEPESDDTNIGIPVDRHLCRAVYGHHLSDADITRTLQGKGYSRTEDIITSTAHSLSLRPIEFANRLWYVIRRLSSHRGQHSFPFSSLDWRPLYPGGEYPLSMRVNDKPRLNLQPGCSYRPWLEELPFTSAAFGNESLDDRGRVRVNLGVGHRFANTAGWQYRYRLVMMYKLGRALRTDEHSHHTTPGSKIADDPSQLELLLAEGHGKYHAHTATLAGWRDDLGRFVERTAPDMSMNTNYGSSGEVPF